MSIYATLWELRFPKDQDAWDDAPSAWVTVIAQAVPAHIGSPTPACGYPVDTCVDFLPPPIETDGHGDAPYYRAVVFITDETKKGTDRHGQEYVDPLLTISGEEYATLPFGALFCRLQDAVTRRYG